MIEYRRQQLIRDARDLASDFDNDDTYMYLNSEAGQEHVHELLDTQLQDVPEEFHVEDVYVAASRPAIRRAYQDSHRERTRGKGIKSKDPYEDYPLDDDDVDNLGNVEMFPQSLRVEMDEVNDRYRHSPNLQAGPYTSNDPIRPTIERVFENFPQHDGNEEKALSWLNNNEGGALVGAKLPKKKPLK
jgi:hypothetical protein